MFPKYLFLPNRLFQHLETDCSDHFKRPQNLYIYRNSWGGMNLEKDIYTYEELLAWGAKEPTKEELLSVL